jgi:hypothetical protein
LWSQHICTCPNCKQTQGYCNGIIGYLCFHYNFACDIGKRFANLM